MYTNVKLQYFWKILQLRLRCYTEYTILPMSYGPTVTYGHRPYRDIRKGAAPLWYTCIQHLHYFSSGWSGSRVLFGSGQPIHCIQTCKDIFYHLYCYVYQRIPIVNILGLLKDTLIVYQLVNRESLRCCDCGFYK